VVQDFAQLKALVVAAGLVYKGGGDAAGEILAAAVHAGTVLAGHARQLDLATCDGKDYVVWEAGGKMSRPLLKAKLTDVATMRRDWTRLLKHAKAAEHRYDLAANDANDAIYGVMAALTAGFDIWMPSSRKTPGTFFEILIGSLLGRVLPSLHRTAHVIIPDQVENVSTDIVFSKGARGSAVQAGLVVPVKITTRERVVQPYAHQRILDSVYGEGAFRSILVCMSEMQREKSNNANAICVPGTIRLFQMHLARLSGIYYLDPPRRYLAADITSVVPVRTLGELLAVDLADLIPP
jgi:hypothetical protein